MKVSIPGYVIISRTRENNSLCDVSFSRFHENISYRENHIVYTISIYYSADKPHLIMKECRAETDKAYADLIEHINSLIVVEGETKYHELTNIYSKLKSLNPCIRNLLRYS